MRALVIVIVLAGPAHADRWSHLAERANGLAWLHYELTAVQDARDAAAPHDLILAGARLHGMVGGEAPVAYHVGLDLAAGSTVRSAGLAYDVALFPVGVGLRVGKTSLLAVGGGIGAMGAVGTLDDAMMLPVEATLELGSSWRLLARGRAAWVVGADVRNIAEGAGRWSPADVAKHYKIARGEAMECVASLDVLRVRKLVDEALYGKGVELCARVVATLTKLIEAEMR